MVTCPHCGSDDVSQISTFQFECNNCCEVFDISESDGVGDFVGPDEEEDGDGEKCPNCGSKYTGEASRGGGVDEKGFFEYIENECGECRFTWGGHKDYFKLK